MTSKTKPILSAQSWADNGDMMLDVATLWLKDGDTVFDPTFGKGVFWKRLADMPAIKLIPDDLDPAKGPGGDFRDMTNRPAGAYDAVVFDPAYVTPGGRDKSSIQAMNAAYGMDTTKITLKQQWDDILLGLDECIRVTRPGGLVMVKVMPYISSAKYHPYHHRLFNAMTARRCTVVDEFFFIRPAGGPQPGERTRKCRACKGLGVLGPLAECGACEGLGRVLSGQVHSRANMSTLIVAKTPRRKP